MKSNPQTLWLSHYWLISKTSTGKKLEPNLYHKPENNNNKKGNNPRVFNSHESRWHADEQTRIGKSLQSSVYDKSLWHAGWKYPIILWQSKLPCSLKTMVWSNYCAGDPRLRTIPAFQQQCTSQPHGLGILEGHANIYKFSHPEVSMIQGAWAMRKDSLKNMAKGSLMFHSKGLAVLPISDIEENTPT